MPGFEDDPEEETLRRWSTAPEPTSNATGEGFPPGWPLGHSMSEEELAVLYSRPHVEVEIIPPPPLPEVKARPATLPETPGGARSVAKSAGKGGFISSVSYARGPRLDRRGRVVEITDSIVVRAAHPDGRKFVAAWITKTTAKGVTSWTFDCAYRLVPEVTAMNSTQMRDYMKGTDA